MAAGKHSVSFKRKRRPRSMQIIIFRRARKCNFLKCLTLAPPCQMHGPFAPQAPWNQISYSHSLAASLNSRCEGQVLAVHIQPDRVGGCSPKMSFYWYHRISRPSLVPTIWWPRCLLRVTGWRCACVARRPIYPRWPPTLRHRPKSADAQTLQPFRRRAKMV
jgi:hypothetical protein